MKYSRFYMFKKLVFSTMSIMIVFTIDLYSEPIRIMPLGDSITYGVDKPESELSSYRNDLWYQLEDAEYSVDFVGSGSAGESITPAFDTDNEGHPWWTSYEIADKVYNFLADNQADIVLLHIGTNDHDDSPAGVEDILNEIDLYEANYHHPIEVILALIINRQTHDQTISDFNNNLINMANSRIANGDKITIVDMEYDAGFTTSDYADDVHPNNTGYEKMATVWYSVLKNILPKISHPRMMSDVNGDGMQDVVGFADNGVYVALSTGTDFGAGSYWHSNFGANDGWTNEKNPRMLADVNGDGMQDVVGFANAGTYVSTSISSEFGPASYWIRQFGYDQGWR